MSKGMWSFDQAWRAILLEALQTTGAAVHVCCCFGSASLTMMTSCAEMDAPDTRACETLDLVFSEQVASTVVSRKEPAPSTDFCQS